MYVKHLQVVDFVMVFMLWIQKPVCTRECNHRENIFIRPTWVQVPRHNKQIYSLKFHIFMITQQKQHNSPYYIVYIVSVHAFESLCWKAHSNDVWVDICSGRSQGNEHCAWLVKGTITETPSTTSLTWSISRSTHAFQQLRKESKMKCIFYLKEVAF